MRFLLFTSLVKLVFKVVEYHEKGCRALSNRLLCVFKLLYGQYFLNKTVLDLFFLIYHPINGSFLLFININCSLWFVFSQIKSAFTVCQCELYCNMDTLNEYESSLAGLMTKNGICEECSRLCSII